MRYILRPYYIEADQVQQEMDVCTNTGTEHAEVGDWIVISSEGEVHVCDDELFNQLYMPSEHDCPPRTRPGFEPERERVYHNTRVVKSGDTVVAGETFQLPAKDFATSYYVTDSFRNRVFDAMKFYSNMRGEGDYPVEEDE